MKLKRWEGNLGDNVEATMRLKNALLDDPKRKCRCGNMVDLDEIADVHLGAKLGIALKNMEDHVAWSKRYNVISSRAVEGKILLDKFFDKQLRLWSEYQRKIENWGARDISYSTSVICSKCQTSLGQLTVTLRLVAPPEIIEVSKNHLIRLEASKEMLAHVSKRMQFGSVEQLKEWREDKDIKQAKAVLQEAIAKLKTLNLPYEISQVTGTLTEMIRKADEANRGQKVEFVNAVEKVMKERLVVIR